MLLSVLLCKYIVVQDNCFGEDNPPCDWQACEPQRGVTKLDVRDFLSDCQVFRGCQSCKIGCQRSQKLFARLLERCVKNLHIDEYRWGFEDWAKQYWPNGARQCNGAIGKLSWIAPPGDSSWCWIYVYSFTQRRLSYEVVNVGWSISNLYIESCLGLRESVYDVVFKNYIGLRSDLVWPAGQTDWPLG